MGSLGAFRDAPPKREEVKQVATIVPKYNPKPVAETYKVGGVDITIDNGHRMVYVNAGGECSGELCIPFDGVSELAKFLEWAVRERMEAAVNEQVQKP